jgi:hypothetical protein
MYKHCRWGGLSLLAVWAAGVAISSFANVSEYTQCITVDFALKQLDAAAKIYETEGEGEEPLLFHSADWNRGPNYQIDLQELLRVIQFYNSEGYYCASQGDPMSEDGYRAGPGENQTCEPHSSDYRPQDWKIDLSELLRLIQFFVSGGYYPCDNPILGEDGFCPGRSA